MIITGLCGLCLIAVYKFFFTLHVMDELGLDREDLGQDFVPQVSDLSFSPSMDLQPTFITNDFSVAIASSVTNKKTVSGNFMCETDDYKLKFMVLVQR